MLISEHGPIFKLQPSTKWPPSTRFLHEARELETRWAKAGLLDGLSEKYIRSATASLMEAQRLCNEIAKPPAPKWPQPLVGPNYPLDLILIFEDDGTVRKP